MLKDPKAKDMVADFFTQWLGVTELKTVPKDAKVYPTYTPELINSMLAETAAFVAAAVLDGDGKHGDLVHLEQELRRRRPGQAVRRHRSIGTGTAPGWLRPTSIPNSAAAS